MQPDASMDLTMIGNTIFTGAGDDEVDVALSDGFKNSIFTGSGVDTIYAGTRDVITGGSGDDWLSAEAGDGNRLSGGLGNDSFIIGSSANRALGGAGDDKFYVLGGAGTNHLNGGAGSDQFWLVSEIGDRPAAKQFVMDFQLGSDKVGLQGLAFSSLSFSQVAGDTLLKVAGVEVGHFTNLSAASLNNQSNFAGLLAA
jgi:glycerophosphoryl diester phosphodiesterase